MQSPITPNDMDHLTHRSGSAPIPIANGSQQPPQFLQTQNATDFHMAQQGRRDSEQGKEVVQETAIGGGPYKAICGLPKKTFRLFLAIVLILIAAAIGGGVGGYMSGKNKKGASQSASGFTVLATISVPGATTPTVVVITVPGTTIPPSTASVTHTASSASITLSQAVGNSTTCAFTPRKSGDTTISCPEANKCLYTSLGSSSKFQLLCGTNVPDVNLINNQSFSMPDCIDQCVAYNSRNRAGACVGVSWDYTTRGGHIPTCWLKAEIGSQSDADEVESAILLEY